jgi:hypothetical protein
MRNIFYNEKIISVTFFLIIFLFGYSIYPDYGISIDEDNSRINGFVSLKYVLELFSLDLLDKLNQIITVPNIQEYKEQGNGVVFEMPLAFIEIFFGIKNIRDIYLIRHLSTFIIFFISLIYFFLILKKRFKSYIFGMLGVFFLLISPRIFAQSFYNSKDIVFMSLNIINLYYGIKYLEKSNFKNGLMFSIFTGLSVGTRLLGIYLPVLICFIKITQILRSNKKKIIEFIKLSIIIFFLLLFIYLFWPYLWSNPFINFYSAFANIGNHEVGIYNFFLGQYIPVEFVPWYYTFVWIFISTPITHLILFLLGFSFFVKRLINRILKIDEKKTHNDLWRGKDEKIDVILFMNIFIPILSIIIMHSSLYTGWRHMFFIYPSFVFFIIYTIKMINALYVKNKHKLIVLSVIFLLPTIFWMYKNHPYQYTYFNSIYKKNFNKFFDMDYWGLTNYHSIKYILKKNKQNDQIAIGIIGNGDLNLSRSFLSKSEKEKIVISENLDAVDFLIDNYARWNGIKFLKNQQEIDDKFKIYYEIQINGVAISSIYKKIGKN